MNNILSAVVFPGQASQKMGMLSTLAYYYPLVEDTFNEASEVLGYDMWKLIQNGPIEEINKTYRAQPMILTASVAVWKIWKKQGGYIPKIMAGHSLGEYSALVCSESIDLSSAVRLVMIRGMLMQEAVPPGNGAMSIIIGLSNDIVYELCKISEQDQIVAPACFNAPGYVVIAGDKNAVIRVNILCKREGAKYTFILPISVPSHCMLMKPVVKQLKLELDKIIIRPPRIPVINNTDVRIEYHSQAIRNALLRQLYTPVRWSEIIEYLVNYQIKIFLEMGPGKILTRLIQNIVDDDSLVFSINNPISLLEALKINTSSNTYSEECK